MSNTAVILCTRGRPHIVAALASLLAKQSKPPAHIFVIATRAEDIAGLDRNQRDLTVAIGRTGLTLQRNDGLALAGSRFSTIVFFEQPLMVLPRRDLATEPSIPTNSATAPRWLEPQ